MDEVDDYNKIDQDEIDELLADEPAAQANPTVDAEVDEAPVANVRPRRNRRAPEVLTYERDHSQLKRQTVKFTDDEMHKKLLKLEQCHNIVVDASLKEDMETEYSRQEAMVIARFMHDLSTKARAKDEKCFGQQYIFNEGLKKFGKRGNKAGSKEMDQLRKREVLYSIHVSEMTAEEKKKSVEALMFLTEKRDKSIKGRMVYNGKPTRKWLSREDAASPTAALESILLTSIIDAKEGRDVMSADVPNAFVQTPMPPTKEGEARVIMKITGVLVDLLVEMAPEVYGPYVVYENGKKVLYVQLMKALYGMLVASLLWYKLFKTDLEGEGYKFNPYDPCVANKDIHGKQHTIRFHVDDLMCSHVDKKVNDKFEKWLNKKYGGYGEVQCTRGKVHDYLGMKFDFSVDGYVSLDMCDYISAMVDDFPAEFKIKGTAPTPAASDLLQKGDSEPIDKFRKETFHTFVAKGLYACKRARPDTNTAISILSGRTQNPNEEDWEKLIHFLKYCNGTRGDKLWLSAEDLSIVKWHVDASFAVHPDFRSHTGGTMTYRTGSPITVSRKQKLNSTSSTIAELIGADDMSIMMLWTKLFMEAQGHKVKQNILYQDNKSTILLENNGKRSSGKRTRAINIRYFFLTDQIEKGNLEVVYCPTKKMTADFMTKPVQGELFRTHKRKIMGSPPKMVATGACWRNQKRSKRS